MTARLCGNVENKNHPTWLREWLRIRECVQTRSVAESGENAGALSLFCFPTRSETEWRGTPFLPELVCASLQTKPAGCSRSRRRPARRLRSLRAPREWSRPRRSSRTPRVRPRRRSPLCPLARPRLTSERRRHPRRHRRTHRIGRSPRTRSPGTRTTSARSARRRRRW